MSQLVLDNKVITTQCQTCKSKFSVRERELDAGGNTRCPQCNSRIQISLCPSCGTSYSIVTDRLKPMTYTTKCKKCYTRFNIEVSAPSPARNHEVSAQEKKISPFAPPPNFERKPIDLFGKTSVSTPAYFRESGSGTIKTELQTPHTKDDNKAEKLKTKPMANESKTRNDSAPLTKTISEATNANNGQRQTSEYVEGSARKYFDKKQSDRYSLRGIFTLYSQAFHPLRILLASVGVALSAAAVYLSSIVRELPTQNLSAYLSSFLMYIPLAFVYTGYVVSASVIAKTVLNTNAREPMLRKTLETAIRALLSAFVTGCISLLALNAALVFLTRIPQTGTFTFALVLLPVYLGSLFFTLLLFGGIWLLPQIHAKKEYVFIEVYRELFSMLRQHGGKLLYYIPLMCASMALLSSLILFAHKYAFRLTEIIATAVSPDASTRSFALIPVSLQKFISIVTQGSSGDLAGLISGGVSLADSAAGIITGAVLATIALLLYGLLLSVCATVSAHTLALIERDAEIPDTVKSRGLWAAFALAALIAAVRFFLLR